MAELYMTFYLNIQYNTRNVQWSVGPRGQMWMTGQLLLLSHTKESPHKYLLPTSSVKYPGRTSPMGEELISPSLNNSLLRLPRSIQEWEAVMLLSVTHHGLQEHKCGRSGDVSSGKEESCASALMPVSLEVRRNLSSSSVCPSFQCWVTLRRTILLLGNLCCQPGGRTVHGGTSVNNMSCMKGALRTCLEGHT